MILLAYDIETTGLDKQKDRVIEVGLALYSTGQRKILESAGFLVQSDGVPITQEITDITGITQAAVDRFGYEPLSAIEDISDWVAKADAIVAHNGYRFDRPMTENWAKRLNIVLPEKLWVDTMTDIPGVTGEQLITMCAKKGFVNPNQHSAEDDAKAVLKMLEIYNTSGTSFESVVERAKSPLVLLRSHQERNRNEDAKRFKFRWSPKHELWWKAVKEEDIPALANQVPFKVSYLDKQFTFEDLDS